MKWIYDKKPDNSSRYTLGVQADEMLMCFGINPSTAVPNDLDNTLKSVARIAKRHDFDGWLMFNVYPQRATNPNDMHDVSEKVLHAKNLFFIEKYFKENSSKKILAAWGTLIHKREYLKSYLMDIHLIAKKYECEWYSIGKISKKGHPHHPLYLSNTEMMKPFNMDEYINGL